MYLLHGPRGEDIMSKIDYLIFGIIFMIFSIIMYCNIMKNSVPDVYWSYTENKCVKMIIDGEPCDCDRQSELERSDKVWVRSCLSESLYQCQSILMKRHHL